MNQDITQLQVGTKIYNGGDMANFPHFGRITKVTVNRWGIFYEITPYKDPDFPDSEQRKPYSIPASAFSSVYLGHGGTRIVTLAAYKQYRKQQLKTMQKELNRSCRQKG